MTTDRATQDDTGPHRSDPTTLTARSPEDVLALVPVVFGFEPRESLVLLTFGGDRPFHARADLPERPEELGELAAALVDPALRHRVRQVLLVAYSSSSGRSADRALRSTARAFRRAGIQVLDGLRTDGARWHPVPGRPGIPDHGVPYDLSAHRFAAQAVYDGRVVHSSREQLAASIATDPDRVAGVVAALAALVDEVRPALVEGRWARDLVVGHVARRTAPGDTEVARLLRGMLDIRVRDAAWSPLRRDVAPEHVSFWTDVVRRAPDLLVPAPAGLLAFAAWQAGDGALAWCAVERCLESDPDYSLAGLVGGLLTGAVAPTEWEGGFDWTTGTGHGA